MSTPIRIKRSGIPGKQPTVDQLQSGELALNFYDGDLYTKRIRPGIGTDIINVNAGPKVKNVLYVTKDGNDANSGTKLGDAKATIKAAVEASEEGTVIRVSSGVYQEDNPIKLPSQVSIIGDSLREVTVIPINPEDLFHVSPGNYISDMSFEGDPVPGRAICAFDPDNVKYFAQSPYIRNCTNFIPNSIGLKIDGNYAIGPLKSMVLDSFTQYNQGGIGISITNEGYAQLVSLFTIAPDIAVYVGSGSACDLTNSNSSFGNYGFIADGIGRLKYTGKIASYAQAGSDRFVVDLSTNQYDVYDADYDHTTGILSVTTNEPHKFSVGMGVSIVGLGFTCPFEVGIRTYPSGANGYVFQVRTVAPGRYLDAADSIDANKQEIIDKSLSEIAVQYKEFTNSDFYFPGEDETNPRSRYYDSTRLIYKNKQEIVDKSLASIAVGFPSSFTFPTDPVPYDRNRHYDAYNLIQRNKSVIVDLAWSATDAEYPYILTGKEEACKRDLGFFIDAISTDLFTGGNKYSRDFSLQYFTYGGTGSLSGEEPQTIYAFKKARDFMKQAITNTLPGAVYTNTNVSTGTSTYGGSGPIYSNTDSGSCFDVQQNINTLVGIVTNVVNPAIGTAFLSTFNENLGISTTNICARDLGFLVDAIATDVFTGGNKYSRDFTKQYFDEDDNLIYLNGENIQSAYSFGVVGEYCKKAITNQLNYKELDLSVGFSTYPNVGISQPILSSGNPDSCADVQSNIDNLVGIVTNVIGTSDIEFLDTFNENPGVFSLGVLKCARDLGYIVDAVSSDIREYTNKNILNATKAYFNRFGNLLLETGISGEKEQSIVAFKSVAKYANRAITNQLNNKNLSLIPDYLIGSNTSIDSCSDVTHTVNTLVGILTTFIGEESLDNLPSVSMASTIFSAYVGTSTLPHTYNSGGVVNVNIIRPFDGQVVYFSDLYYTVKKLNLVDGGSGYMSQPVVTIDPPEASWGVPAQAVAVVENGSIIGFEIVSNGRGYTTTPRVTIYSDDVGINTAKATCEIFPTYYSISKSTLPTTSGICTITINENLPYEVGIGSEVPFFKQSRVLATGHSFEFIGSGTEVPNALPFSGGVPIQENETDARNGGLVVYTSTDQSGNFRIGDGVIIDQNTGTISGTFYSKSLFATVTPFILALGG